MKTTRFLQVASLLSAVLTLVPHRTDADTYTWSNNGTDWNSNANWGGSGFPGSSSNDLAIIGANATVTTANLTSSVNLPA